LSDFGFRETFQEERSGWLLRQLTLGDPVHAQPNKAACTRPHVLVQVRPDAPGESEPPRPGIIVNGPLDRTEYLRYHLPLVEQHRLRLRAQSNIGVCSECGGFSWPVEANDGGGILTRCRGLARGARPRDEQRRELGEQL
jgi:hypothetical protein